MEPIITSHEADSLANVSNENITQSPTVNTSAQLYLRTNTSVNPTTPISTRDLDEEELTPCAPESEELSKISVGGDVVESSFVLDRSFTGDENNNLGSKKTTIPLKVSVVRTHTEELIKSPLLYDDDDGEGEGEEAEEEGHHRQHDCVGVSEAAKLKAENAMLKKEVEEMSLIIKLKNERISELLGKIDDLEAHTRTLDVKDSDLYYDDDAEQLEKAKTENSNEDHSIVIEEKENMSIPSASFAKDIVLIDSNSPAFSETNMFEPLESTTGVRLNPLHTPLQQQESLERATSPSFAIKESPEIKQPAVIPNAVIIPTNPSPIDLPERSDRRTVLRDSTLSAASSEYSNISPYAKIRSPEYLGSFDEREAITMSPSPAGRRSKTPETGAGNIVSHILMKEMTLGSSPRKGSPKGKKFIDRNSSSSPLKSTYCFEDKKGDDSASRTANDDDFDHDDEFTFNNDSSTSLNIKKEPVYKALVTPTKKHSTTEVDIFQSYMYSRGSVGTDNGLNITKKEPSVLSSASPASPSPPLPQPQATESDEIAPVISSSINNKSHNNDINNDNYQGANFLPAPTPLNNQQIGLASPSIQKSASYLPGTYIPARRPLFKSESEADSLYSEGESPIQQSNSFFSSGIPVITTPSQQQVERRSSITKTPSPQKKSYMGIVNSPMPPVSHSQKPSDSSQYDYLSNSFDTTVITLNSCVDIDAILEKKEDFKITFMVNSSERELLIPLYQVEHLYSDFLKFDYDVRYHSQLKLPQLPDKSAFLKIDPPVWDTQKAIIKMYISELCRVMRMQRGSGIWRLFKGFFTPHDSNDYDMSKKESTFVSFSSKGLKKSYKLAKLTYDTIENVLFVNEVGSKNPDVFHMSDIIATRENQILNISRKKKKAFKSNKHYVLYSESLPDAEEWFKLINDNQMTDSDQISIGSSPSVHNGNTTPYAHTTTALNGSEQASANASSITLTPQEAPTPTSSIQEGKWFGLKRSRDSAMPHSPIGGNNGSSSTGENVLEFKSMPYPGAMSTSSSTVSAMPNTYYSNTNGNNSLPTSGKITVEPVFQRIDSSQKYFGSTLSESFEACPTFKIYDRSVPSIVYRSISYLLVKNASYSEGIFRLNGMMSEVKKIQELFNESNDCDFTQLNPQPDVHSIATLFKRYLRTLRITIIPETEAKQLMSLTLSSDFVHTVPTIKSVLNQLPKLNFDVLYALFKYFTEVLRCKEFNKMSVSALSVLMAPNLTPYDGAKEICAELLINFAFYFEDGKMLTEDAERKAI